MNQVTNPPRQPLKHFFEQVGRMIRKRANRRRKIEFGMKREVLENYLSDAGKEKGSENDDALLGPRHKKKLPLPGQEHS